MLIRERYVCMIKPIKACGRPAVKSQKGDTIILMKWFFWIGLLLFSFWLMFHTFSYDSKTPAMLISTKVWSDFGQHIPVIRSFSLGNNRTEHPLYPGEPMRYHFLFYAFVGFLEKVGLRIDWALNLPSALGFFLLMAMIYALSYMLFSNRLVSFLSVLFFLFNGSLSFIRFFQNHTVADIFANSQFPSFAPWGPGDISAFWNLNIYTNQRHLGLAFGIGLALLYVFLKLEKIPFKKQAIWIIPVSIMLGIYPYFHQPTLLILAVCMIVYFFVFPTLRKFLLVTGLVSLAFIVPQISLLGPKRFSWYPGYLIHDSLSLARFLSYWWQNLGISSILIPVGFFVVQKYVRRALLPIFFIFMIASLFTFSVEVAASHKLFNFALILGNMITAYLVVKMKNYVIAGLLIFFLTVSGVIDFFAVYNDPKGAVKDIPADKTATWILKNTPADAVFLNSSFFYHPASIAGRKIYLGWPYFAWSEGHDTTTRYNDWKKMYEEENLLSLCMDTRKADISYATVQTKNADSELKSQVKPLEKNSRPVYQNDLDGYSIYDLSGSCKNYQ